MTKLTKWKFFFGKSEKNDLQKRVGKTAKNYCTTKQRGMTKLTKWKNFLGKSEKNDLQKREADAYSRLKT